MSIEVLMKIIGVNNMQREIKFRAYDFRHEKMFKVDAVYKDQIDYEDDGETDFDDYASMYGYLSREEVVLMQYTGLKDKNGVEIYEGDIVEINVTKTDWQNKNRSSELAKFIVVYDHSSFCLKKIGEDKFLMAFCSLNENGFLSKEKLIGNIYQNPELVERNTI